MKENANPTIYNVSKIHDNPQQNPLLATPYLQRFDCHEASHFNSLYRLDNNQNVLDPVERSVQCALESMDEFISKHEEGVVGSLSILHGAGIKTRPQDADTSTLKTKFGAAMEVDTKRMHRFKPAITNDKCTQNEQEQLKNIDTNSRDPITQLEVFDIIRNIQDPEHPLTLEQLNVVNLDHVQVHDEPLPSSEHKHSTVFVNFTPTIPHCSMATLIGLCIRVKLLRSLPSRFKVNVKITPGTHASEFAVNRQLNDKERVVAALENVHLTGVVNKCIKHGMQ